MSDYEILMNDIKDRFEYLDDIGDFTKSVLSYIEKYKPNTSKSESDKAPAYKIDKQLEKLLTNNDCKSFSDYNEIYSILAPIAFDTTPATKDSDTARIGIFRLFASELATDAIVKDMSERFLADKGMNSKCSKLYYELLTKYDLGDEVFSQIVFESIPLQYKINSVMNPHNKTDDRKHFVDSFVAYCLENAGFKEQWLKNMNDIALHGDLFSQTQNRIIENALSGKPKHGTSIVAETLLTNGKTPSDVFEFAINQSKISEEKLRIYILSASQDCGLSGCGTIAHNIVNGYPELLNYYLIKNETGKFPQEDDMHEVIKYLKKNIKDPEILDLLYKKEQNLFEQEANAYYKGYNIAYNFTLDTRFELCSRTSRSISPGLLARNIAEKAHDYVRAKQFVDEYEKNIKTKTNEEIER